MSTGRDTRTAPAPVDDPVDPATNAPQLDDLEALRAAAHDCTGCELWEPATQTVFGAGPSSAWLMFVGEQPGDREDLAGEPFVGPAGKLLDRALEQAGITRDETYVTNAVKHFRFERRGSRRIHKTPAVGHVRACRPWLDGSCGWCSRRSSRRWARRRPRRYSARSSRSPR